MAYWILRYEVVDDYVARRGEFRSAHLELASDFAARGELLLGGALEEPVDASVLVFRADDVSVVEGFVARDPYVVNGLVRARSIRPWRVVVGAAALPEDRPA